MRSENMSKSLLTAISPKFCSPYRKSWLLYTMVTADFGPEIELMLFLRMRAKEIAKSLGTCISIEELFPYYRQYKSLARMAGSGFRPEASK